ncbi:MAG TPA: urease accessory protein UreF [Hyphomicrobiales bacterium]|nr:urease accessory protein UreF [Kaistiaceae bacterium]HQF30626.1 urease accessory protein UreF [Hyphomicrobiales bacterium]
MIDAAALFRLMTWLSPSYPVGAYTYSHGLEWAVEEGAIRDGETLRVWLDGLLVHGAGRTDAILFRAAHAATRGTDEARLDAIAELAAAFQPTAERRLESLGQGRAFVAATAGAFAAPRLAALAARQADAIAYPVAVAIAAAEAGIDVDAALAAYLHGFAANLVSAGVRLVPLGQSAGIATLAALEPVIAAMVETSRALGLDDLGGATILSDISSMRHETQYTRLFRS